MMETGAVLDNYVQFHHLKTYPLKKFNKPGNATGTDRDKEFAKDTLSSENEDQNEEVDFEGAEFGSSSSKEENESDESHYDNPLALLPV